MNLDEDEQASLKLDTHIYVLARIPWKTTAETKAYVLALSWQVQSQGSRNKGTKRNEVDKEAE